MRREIVFFVAIITIFINLISSQVEANALISPTDISIVDSSVIQETTSASTAEGSSSVLSIVWVVLLLGVSGGAYYYISTLKKEAFSKDIQLNDFHRQLKSKEAHVLKIQQAYQKTIGQKKEMKAVFAKEYDKLVIKYKELLKIKEKLSEQQAAREELEETSKTLEKTQALLLQSEKMSSLGQLTAGIAHEINNPVNFVANGVNTLKDNFKQLNVFIENYKRICELESLEEIKKYYKIQREDDHHFNDLQTSTNESLDDVEYGTTRITEIVNGLRVFARHDEVEIKEADLNEVVENAIVILKPKYKKKAKVLKDLDANIKPIKCLPGQLNQALVNLIANACDAIDFKGTINVKTEEQDDDHVKISIRDNGKGMSEDMVKKIFDPFFTTKEVGKGTGLGLAITYGIIEKHNGTITVESEEGKGTEFVITIPKKLRKVNKSMDPALA
ncbi:His Kinase A (phospho-acceptor) domain-containing protein [Reichenbachiella faecimaris]|uniref:histidine kinase n=1 Tax=Reichenbachiella faecimaris TaxID=692418 RepID=A0A1W2G9A6_REIFA|nr:ATP-binding protein [Reichenbachiella faecimaris]SMD32928.1 His Kinase A (phospho-acceptor) domain-containing protein [Reichenbachiella faecimaris]